ncbi:cytochrome c [Roseimicrobium gellanilyticum]|uniref:Cytochrome c n=2 Tax=Roseimicrobium gellanilyticum TaxID=748857 RepID=A0A366H9J3_9BACT|nr:cytochrome c [Roseimicrobium gellanilyticum]
MTLMTSPQRWIAVGACLICTNGLAHAAQEVLPQKLEYNKHIRPILADRCFRCHGADERARKAKLRLDDFDQAVSAKALIPGDAEHSALVQRILTADQEDVMPPPDSHLSLSADEKALLKRWVEEGAAYQKHWAFIPPVMPAVPQVSHEGTQPENPIDAFVLANLKAHGLKAAPPAERAAWLRRVTFALTGLPPSTAELEAFFADTSPVAREKVVDRLLDAPAYGEHFGKQWMDAARYADSYGRHEDGDMIAWPWRDWVIHAFNSNLPYNRFVEWQTAGDLLPGATVEQRVATAFNRFSPQSNESGSDPLEFRLDQVSDRVRVNGLAFMGLTMECAKCHDHKYDPISQKEYWQMAAMFDNIEENGVYSQYCPKAVPSPSILLPNQAEQLRLGALQWQIAAVERELDDIKKRVRPQYDAWIAANGVPGELTPGAWNRVKGWFGGGDIAPYKPQAKGRFLFDDAKPKGGKDVVNNANKKKPGRERAKLESIEGPPGRGRAVLLKGDDEITFPGLGEYHKHDRFSFALWMQPREHRDRAVVISWSRGGLDDGRGYEVLLENEVPSFALMHFHPGNEIRIRAKSPLPLNQWTHFAVSYDGSSRASGLKMWINGEPVASETVQDHLQKDIARREEWGDIDRDAIFFALGGRFHDSPLKNCAVDEFHVFSRSLSDGETRHLAGLHATADDWYDWWLQTKCQEWKDMAHSAMLLRKKLTATTNDVLEMMVMQERPALRPSFVRVRGDYRQPSAEVKPGMPEAVLPFPDKLPRNRLGLAQWLTSSEHPLTSRVAVNRLWQTVFGRGLVGTPEDFGTRGELPTHPELLDWLACTFTQHGWDVKRMVRLMVLSETFGQSIRPENAATLSQDPENKLLARGPHVRLTAEELRDQALATCGLLNPKIGGPSARPYVPEHFYQESGLQQSYKTDTGGNLYRRSLYTFWRRTLPPPDLAAFDAPSREFCVVRREQTTSPAQALMLLNNTQYVEAQRVLAERLVNEHRDDSQARCVEAFRLFTSREPTGAETTAMMHLLEVELEFFHANPTEASTLLHSNGQAPVKQNLPPDEVAATTLLVRALMSHDESLHR